MLDHLRHFFFLCFIGFSKAGISSALKHTCKERNLPCGVKPKKKLEQEQFLESQHFLERYFIEVSSSK
jgi:hypothetical protein